VLRPEMREIAANDAIAQGQKAPYLDAPESKLPRGNFLSTIEAALHRERQSPMTWLSDTVAIHATENTVTKEQVSGAATVSECC